jgi:5-methylcytosine-specific restriction endonuclease McrA
MSVLAERALVLNRSWTAICTTTVRDALVMAYREIAQIICPDTCEAYDFTDWTSLAAREGEAVITTPLLRIRVPEVIVLKRYNGFPLHTVAFSRRNIYRRDAYTCQYCGSRPGSELLSIDHVVPRSRGGRSNWVNCVLACVDCNKRKADRTLEEAGIVLHKAPGPPTFHGALEISIGRRKASWERFISERYWNVELRDD